MTRLAILLLSASLLTAGATAVAASRAMQPRLVITRETSVTATTEDLRPLLDASIAAAHQAADICREEP